MKPDKAAKELFAVYASAATSEERNAAIKQAAQLLDVSPRVLGSTWRKMKESR